MVAVKTKIIKIGNSQGIRIPKPVLDQIRLWGEVELWIEADQIIIRPARSPRFGWDEAFQQMAANGDDQLLDAPVPSLSNWDEEEW